MLKHRIVVLAMFLSLFLYTDGLSLARSSDAESNRRKLSCGMRSNLRMDLESGSYERSLLHRSGPLGKFSIGGESIDRSANGRYDADSLMRTVHSAETRHGMPWGESIGRYTPPPARRRPHASGPLDQTLLYMPFWSRQMSHMKSNLTNLQSLPTKCGSTDVSYRENPAGTARIVNAAFASDEYRKIRMTYYDAGDGCQVFNSLWYPHPRYNLPVLGIDLLAFNRRSGRKNSSSSSQGHITGKYLSVIDFQPIHESGEAGHASPFEHLLGTIRTDYPSLQGQMSDRFYDHKRHFSSQMLYGRCDSEGFVHSELGPAFMRSIDAYVGLLRETTPDDSPGAMKRVLEGQAAYDTYSSTRDPARALFGKMFGEQWADGYVFDFLFDLSDRPEA